MGASGWDYYAPFNADVRATLADLHKTVLANREYYWYDDDVPRPATLAAMHELFSSEEGEDLASEGTHSILDIFRVAAAGSPDDFGTIIPLSDAEVFAAFGTNRPTRAQFDAVYNKGADLIAEFPRWSGRFTALYVGDVPTETVIWGVSGD